MKPTIALIALLLATPVFADETITGTTSGSITISKVSTCFIASLAMTTNEVTVDWDCVEKKDKEFLDGKSTDEYGAIAHVMKAIHDGTAKVHSD